MAIKAGRVGILPEELTPEGKLKNAGGGMTPATAETLGGVKVGEGLQITEDGTLSTTGGTESPIEIITCAGDVTKTIDKTAEEVKSIFESGKPVIIKLTPGSRYYLANGIVHENNNYLFKGIANIAGYTGANRIMTLTIALDTTETEIRYVTLTDAEQTV